MRTRSAKKVVTPSNEICIGTHNFDFEDVVNLDDIEGLWRGIRHRRGTTNQVGIVRLECVFFAVFSHCVVYLYCVFCAFVGVVFNIVLVMCQLSCCCSGLSCLHVVRWCVGMVHFVFCVFHNHLCLIQPLCQIQPLCAFQSSGRNNGW